MLQGLNLLEIIIEVIQKEHVDGVGEKLSFTKAHTTWWPWLRSWLLFIAEKTPSSLVIRIEEDGGGREARAVVHACLSGRYKYVTIQEK